MVEFSVGNGFVHVDTVSENTDIKELIHSYAGSQLREDNEDPFCIVDLGCIIDQYKTWCAYLPTVKPFYAVKCNDDIAMLKTLAVLGAGFDCASKNEIKTVLSLGVSTDRMIYANPCKQVSYLKYASSNNVRLMTFDSEHELHKVLVNFPAAQLVLRIRSDDPQAVCQLGIKFGCSVTEGCRLLEVAKELGLDVVGVSFHIGSGSQNPKAYQMALEKASKVFEHAENVGYHFSLLDIGGGFPGTRKDIFKKLCIAINESLDTYFSEYRDLRVIAEPGRYFACASHTLVVNVISIKEVRNEDGSIMTMYYVSDGTYGSFNCIHNDHTSEDDLKPVVLKSDPSTEYSLSTVWGPTCDGIDCIIKNVRLPKLDVGDWLYFPNMGAYTMAASSGFNGFSRPKAFYYVKENNSETLKRLYATSEGSIDMILHPSHLPSTVSTTLHTVEIQVY